MLGSRRIVISLAISSKTSLRRSIGIILGEGGSSSSSGSKGGGGLGSKNGIPGGISSNNALPKTLLDPRLELIVFSLPSGDIRRLLCLLVAGGDLDLDLDLRRVLLLDSPDESDRCRCDIVF